MCVWRFIFTKAKRVVGPSAIEGIVEEPISVRIAKTGGLLYFKRDAKLYQFDAI